MPSLGSGEATAVASTTLSPSVTNAAPEACLAMRPVSKTRRLPPVSSTATSCFMESSFTFSIHLGNLGVQEGPGRNGRHTQKTCSEPEGQNRFRLVCRIGCDCVLAGGDAHRPGLRLPFDR